MNSECYYLNLLSNTYPDFKFKSGKVFSWYTAENRIRFIPCSKKCEPEDGPCENFYKLAHEIGHAKLKHEDYKTKIELNRMELAAWAEAEKIVKKLKQPKIPEHVIDSAMDSYVNHANQDECPECDLSLVGDVCPNCSIIN